jgi:hypothetical protein
MCLLAKKKINRLISESKIMTKSNRLAGFEIYFLIKYNFAKHGYYQKRIFDENSLNGELIRLSSLQADTRPFLINLFCKLTRKVVIPK